jgi:hypothetical protein
MEECLSGRFLHLNATAPAPTWLADALEKDPSRLHGTLMAFHWEGWGWHAARIGDTSAKACNFSALYLDRWREDHSLFASDYGTGGAGNWVLLEGTPPPILDFHAGKYKVKRGGADVWLRADDLIEYSGSDLAAAREAKKAAAAEASQTAVDAELDTGGFAIGRRVFAKGLGGDGEVAWFVAQVIGHRERFPPCGSLPLEPPSNPRTIQDKRLSTTLRCICSGSRSSTSPRIQTARRAHWHCPCHARRSCLRRTCRSTSQSEAPPHLRAGRVRCKTAHGLSPGGAICVRASPPPMC